MLMDCATQLSGLTCLWGMPIVTCPACGKMSTKRSKVVVFSATLTSSTPSSISENMLPNHLNVQIGPWRSKVRANYAMEHKSYAGGDVFVYHLLLRAIPKQQPFSIHVETPGVEFGIPLDISSFLPSVLVYDETWLPIVVGKITPRSGDSIPLLRRVTLEGYPYKIHQKSAVIRGMFHSAEDVEYFSPIEIVGKTPHQKGYIKESLGTHGLMKVSFNRTIPKQEPIFMHIYKKMTE